jgi:hypothetical protein
MFGFNERKEIKSGSDYQFSPVRVDNEQKDSTSTTMTSLNLRQKGHTEAFRFFFGNLHPILECEDCGCNGH